MPNKAPPKAKMRIIRLTDIAARPDHANVLPSRVRKAIVRHIGLTGLYPPLIVRPHAGRGGEYEIIDGHWRRQVLAELGRRTARCEVWALDDGSAELLSVSLNRLRGRVDARRGRRQLRGLVRRLGADCAAEALALTPAAIRDALRPLRPPRPGAAAGAVDLRPVFFHIPAPQAGLLAESLKAFGSVDCGRGEALMRIVAAARSVAGTE